MAPWLIDLFACASSEPTDIDVEVSAVIPTAATVRWHTEAETSGHVSYGEGLVSASTAVGTEHEVTIIGMAPDAEVPYRINVDDGFVTDELVFSTGSLAAGLPDQTTTGDNDRWIVTTLLGIITGPAILDPSGQVVWFYDAPELFDRDGDGTVEMSNYRARLARDGQSVFFNVGDVSGEISEGSMLVEVSLDGTEVHQTPVTLLAHDFVELDDGSVVVMAVEYRDEVRGDQLIRIEPDGTQTQIWSAWDCFDPAVDESLDPEVGWTFANALDHDAESGDFLLNLRNFSSIVRIDPETRTCPWVFGTVAATLEPQGEVFRYNHQFVVSDDEIVVFDNEGAASGNSRAVVYGPDGVARSSHESADEIHTFVLGDVERLDDGDLFVDWAVGGGFDRVSADGEVVWTARSSLGGAFGFFTPQKTPYE